MTTAASSTALATIQPAFTDAERVALAGYLAGYRGLTRALTARCSRPPTAGGWTGTAPAGSSARSHAERASARPSRPTRSGTRS
jgi:hypothetical protein